MKTCIRLGLSILIAQAFLAGTSRGDSTVPPSDADTLRQSFTAPIIGYDGSGTCSLSYEMLPAKLDAAIASVVWKCMLSLPGFGRQTTGINAVGGNLLFELLSADSVVAASKKYTGMMLLGKTYAFSDTLSLPIDRASAPLVPRWRLTCGGQDMNGIRCGTVAPSKD